MSDRPAKTDRGDPPRPVSAYELMIDSSDAIVMSTASNVLPLWLVVLCDKGDWGSGEYCRERVERGVLEAREAMVLVLSISAKRCLTIELWLKFMMEGLCERKEDGVPRKEVLVDAPVGV